VRNPDTAPKLRTPGVLAEDLCAPLHRVLYVLRSRQHIRPAAMAGRLRDQLAESPAAHVVAKRLGRNPLVGAKH
jgi:hypothetical protein